MKTNLLLKQDLSYKNIIKGISKIAIPVAFQMFLISLLQLVDNLFIGRLTEAEYVAAGVNAINNITFVVATVVGGFVGGIGIFFIQASHSNNINIQHDIFRMKLIWMLIFSGVFLSTAFIFLRPLASLWIAKDADFDTTLDYSFIYGSIVLPSLFLDFLGMIFSGSYKELKKIRVTVLIAIFVILVNSVLNYFLMYYFELGLIGAAYATLIARFIQCVIWISYVFITKPFFVPKFRTFFKIKFSKIFFVFAKPFIWMISGFLMSLAFTIKIMIISQISKQAGASLNSAGVFLQLSRAFTNGFSQAISILTVSFLVNLSQKDFHVYVKRNVWISLIFGIAFGLLSFCFLPLFPILYSNYSEDTIWQSILMVASVAATLWVQMVITVWVSTLKGSGFSKSLLIANGLFPWIIELPIVIVLYFTMDQTGLSYGWIYAISIFVVVLKPLIIGGIYHFNKAKIKPLIKSNQDKKPEIPVNKK